MCELRAHSGGPVWPHLTGSHVEKHFGRDQLFREPVPLLVLAASDCTAMERSRPSKETSLLGRGAGPVSALGTGRGQLAGGRTQKTGCMEAPSAPVWAHLPVCRYHFVRAALGPAGLVQACSWTCSSGSPNSLDSLALGEEQMPYYK